MPQSEGNSFEFNLNDPSIYEWELFSPYKSKYFVLFNIFWDYIFLPLIIFSSFWIIGMFYDLLSIILAFIAFLLIFGFVTQDFFKNLRLILAL